MQTLILCILNVMGLLAPFSFWGRNLPANRRWYVWLYGLGVVPVVLVLMGKEALDAAFVLPAFADLPWQDGLFFAGCNDGMRTGSHALQSVPKGWLYPGLFWGLVFGAGMQDMKTMYFSRRWLVIGGCALLVAGPESLLQQGWSSLLAGLQNPALWLEMLPGICMVLLMALLAWHKSMGIADVWFALFLCLGVKGLQFCAIVMVSVLTGILYGWIHKGEKIPFISFLAIGCFCIWLAGVSLMQGSL